MCCVGEHCFVCVCREDYCQLLCVCCVGEHYFVCVCREDYCQLLYASLPDSHGLVTDVAPAIVKPRKLWSGKQVRYHLYGIPAKVWVHVVR